MINKNLSYLKSNLKRLELDLKSFKKHSAEDLFGDVMTVFGEEAKSQCSLLDEMYRKMEQKYSVLSKYLSFEEKKYKMDDCFADIKQFKDQFVQALQENLKAREREEKNRRAKEAKEKAEKEKKERINQRIDPSNSDQQEGLMEQLLNSLHTGSAFAQHKRKRTKAVTPQSKSPRSG